MPDEFLTITQLAARLGLRERVIQHYVNAGTIPYRKVGKAVRFRWRDVEDWWQQLPGGELPAKLTATRPVTKRILTSPQDTIAPVIALVRGPKGQHRRALQQARGE